MRFPRLSVDRESNAWALAVARARAERRDLLDLTDTDPARLHASLPPDGIVLRARASPPDPKGMRSAREAVARHYADQGATVDPDDILLTASTSEAYAHLFRLLCAPGDAVVVQSPSYPLFEPIADVESVRLEPWRMHYDGAWHLGQAPEEGAPVRAVVIVQPNHPTGTWLTSEDRDSVLAYAKAHDATIVSDEVFSDDAWDGDARPKSLLQSPGDALGVVLGGLSKTCGLPHLKCSWMVVAGPEKEKRRLLEGLEWIADLFLSVNGPVMHALPDLLASRHAFRAAVRRTILENLQRIRAATSRQPAMTMLNAEGGWVAVLRLPAVRSEEDWALELLERGVIVHPGHFYDFESEAFIVVSLIVDPVDFDRGMTVIEHLVAGG